MNCPNCNRPLETNARFCRNCGSPVAAAASPQQYQPASMNDAPTIQAPQQQNPPFQQAMQPPWSQPQAAPPAQSPYYQSPGPDAGTFPTAETSRPRRRRRGCLPGCLIMLLALLLLVVGGWFFALRPYLHDTAQSKIDQVLTNAVNNIPSSVALLPAGSVPIKENVINNLIVLESSPNDIVQNVQVHITPNAMRMDFQVFGLSSDVTGVPQVNQGHLTATNVTIEGIAALIMSPDEITALVNRHLADLQTKINHPIVAAQLHDQEIDLTLGSAGNGQPTVPPISITPTLPPINITPTFPINITPPVP